MPVHNHFFQTGPNKTADPRALQLRGPIVNVEVALPSSLAQIVGQQSGSVIPQPTTGLALIDTGASITAIDEAVVTSLGVQPVRKIQLKTPSDPNAMVYTYMVRMSFPQTGIPIIADPIEVAGVKLQGQNCVALLGRNLLARAVLIYNGPAAHFSISF